MAKKSNIGKDSLVRNPDVILREENLDGALLFNPDTNQIRRLNATSLFIWKHCDSKKNLKAISVSMKEASDGVPKAEIESQVKEFLTNMKTNGFLIAPRVK